MRTTTLVRPAYADKFRCVGPACEDSCCVGWRVDLDQAATRPGVCPFGY